MDDLLNASAIKEQISLVDLLQRLGFNPFRRSGKELFYLSMLRDNDTKPSFTVNEQLNVWYDHGMGKGGTLIDFAQLYWGLSFRDTLQKIKDTCGVTRVILPNDFEKPRRRHAVRIPNYQVEDIKDLGHNYAITEYLQERCVWNVARGLLKEIYYYVEDEKKVRKYFFAAGWQNEFGAWEVRNKYFKGCLGHKAMTYLPGDEGKLVIFEGYFNYLSWRVLNKQASTSVLILNTLSLFQAALQKAKDFANVELYFDRDQAGHEASIEFIRALKQAEDLSATYKGFNDFNDYLKALTRNPGPSA
ncbi:CHC2 zinc finger [Mucilaginibacter pineti]|uniref:CHC2 zinc finger n=1 Tax=Mucilaginibacter pineti TaxID=1391627 RepID=A0A1G7JQ26_9SPHI|nr:toprim domain-containing protein [Mucilaginibacter pineti]SDF26976.1 CHC2 zinc finger [Mucilaginibacter pineti]